MGNPTSKSGSDKAASAGKSSDNESSAKAQTAKAEGPSNKAPCSTKAVDMFKTQYPESRTVVGFLGVEPLSKQSKDEKEQEAQIKQRITGMRAIHAFHLGTKKDEAMPVATERREQILSIFLLRVAQGKQDKAEKLLKISQQKIEIKDGIETGVVINNGVDTTSTLLLGRGFVTDYSRRKFIGITGSDPSDTGISAYEYAYWAKDTHMCRMLEKYMDEPTKATILDSCEAIEKYGLTYEQRGKIIKGSRHFALTTLIRALEDYRNGYDDWVDTDNSSDMKAAWMVVGRAQCDVPTHVINEYCRADRSFNPLPSFKEDNLPREISFYIYNFQTEQEQDEPFFPLVASDSSGPGVDFSLFRGRGVVGAWGMEGDGYEYLDASIDWRAVRYLDVVRTEDLKLSLENLKPLEPSSHLGMTH